MKYYCEDVRTVLDAVESRSEGLTSAEAAARLEKYGRNKLAEGKKVPVWKRFLAQLADPMIIILLAAAAISGVLAVVEGESFADVIIILSVVIINAVLGVYQESKAEAAIEALQQAAAATAAVRGCVPYAAQRRYQMRRRNNNCQLSIRPSLSTVN